MRAKKKNAKMIVTLKKRLIMRDEIVEAYLQNAPAVQVSR